MVAVSNPIWVISPLFLSILWFWLVSEQNNYSSFHGPFIYLLISFLEYEIWILYFDWYFFLEKFELLILFIFGNWSRCMLPICPIKVPHAAKKLFLHAYREIYNLWNTLFNLTLCLSISPSPTWPCTFNSTELPVFALLSSYHNPLYCSLCEPSTRSNSFFFVL